MLPIDRQEGQPVTNSCDMFYGNDSLSPYQLEALCFSSSTYFIKDHPLEQQVTWYNHPLLLQQHLQLKDSFTGPQVQKDYKFMHFFNSSMLKFILFKINYAAFSFNNSCVSEFVDFSVFNFEFKESLLGPALTKQAL